MSKAKKNAARKVAPKTADGEIAAKLAKAYHDMESHVCDLARAAELADSGGDHGHEPLGDQYWQPCWRIGSQA
jgi:hypothetical protein